MRNAITLMSIVVVFGAICTTSYAENLTVLGEQIEPLEWSLQIRQNSNRGGLNEFT